MKKIILRNVIAIILVTFSTSCRKALTSADTTHPIVLPANGVSVVTASNRFAFNFFQKTLQQDSINSNKLISPLSIYTALNMVYNGANAATKDSMSAALQLSGINISDLNNVCKVLINQLPSEDKKVQFSIANSIWYDQSNFQPLPAFLQTINNYYNASVQALNFSDASATGTINKWVAQKTNNKIPTIIDRINPGDLMYLINAIYFNGAWQSAFKTSDTYNDVFHLQDGSTSSVPFMHQRMAAKFFTDSTLSMVELPYGGGKSYSMYVVLPNTEQSVYNFASSLNADMLASDISQMYTTTLNITLPKWEYTYSIDDMNPELALLGMNITLHPGADFSNMYKASQVQPYISRAIHKAYIKVDEQGTEAAAATAVGMGFTAVMNPAAIKADHPFLYAIIEKQTGTIVFMGIVNDPLRK